MSSQPSPLKLPRIPQSQLDVRPIDWSGLNRRFMNPGELEVLVALVNSVKPATMIEIGVNEGRTAKALLANVPSLTHYIGIDVPIGYRTSKEVQRREVPVDAGHLALSDPRFELLLRPRGSLDLEPEDLPRCDVVFIDGDHGYDAVLYDSYLADALTRDGGMIIWHDYHGIDTVDVREVLEASAAEGNPIQYVEGTWIAFMRVKPE